MEPACCLASVPASRGWDLPQGSGESVLHPPASCSSASSAEASTRISSSCSSSALGSSFSPAWGLSGALVVRLGSGLSATAVGIHLAAYASPWLPSFDLLLRLDLGLGFLSWTPPNPSATPVAAASAAGLLGSSLAVSDSLACRLPLLVLLLSATALALLSLLLSSSAAAIPSLVARACLRQLYLVLGHGLRLLSAALARGCAKGPSHSSPFTAASLAAALLQVLMHLLSFLRTCLTPALLWVMLRPPFSPCPKLPDADTPVAKAKAQKHPVGITAKGVCGGPASRQTEGGASLPGPVARVSEYAGGQATLAGQEDESVPRPVRQGPLADVEDESEALRGAEAEVEGGSSAECVTEGDLEELVGRLELCERDEAQGPWEMIVDKACASVDYCAWRRDPQDGGATEYKSWTRFQCCTARKLCAFYLDCEHLASYEAMIRSYEGLGFEARTGQETGRMVKKYPLCSPREYILGWRVWRAPGVGPTGTYYCVTKAVEHMGAPRGAVRRVDAYWCAWRIQEVLVDGVGWCAEVDMYLQEDSGMQRAMAKLAFRRSIWGYIQATEVQLRRYPDAGASPVEEGAGALCGGSSAPVPAPACSLPPSVKHARKLPRWIVEAYYCGVERDETMACLGGGRTAQSSVGPTCLRPSASHDSGMMAAFAGADSVGAAAGTHWRVGGQAEALAQAWLVRSLSAGPGRGRAGTRPASASAPRNGNWALSVGQKALPMLAAAAGIGTMAVARGPVGFAAKLLVACALKALAPRTSDVEARRPFARARSVKQSRSGRGAAKPCPRQMRRQITA